MLTPSTLIEALLLVSCSQKGITFVTSADNDKFVSYKELYENALKSLGNLQSLGLNKGDKVLLYLDDNQKFLEIFWGCILGGIVPVPLAVGNQNMHKLKIIKVWEHLHPCKLITTETSTSSIEKYLKNTQSSHLQLMDDILKVEEFFNFSKKGKLAEISKEDIAFLQFTSGSTGNPKGVVLTHDNLVFNVKDIISASQIIERDRMLSWMPLTHDMGMICFHLTSLFSNSDQYLMPTNLFIRRPVLWLSKANDFEITILYSPNFGLNYFLSAFQKNYTQYQNWNLGSIRLIYNGAEPISFDLCKKFQHTLSPLHLPENIIFPGYGMAEASVAVTLSKVKSPVEQVIVDRNSINIGQEIKYVDENHTPSSSFVTLGKPISHCEVTIVDDEENQLGYNKVGHVRIKGRNVTAGYYNNPTVNQTLFNKAGWLRTGDLGFMVGGKLVITGRYKNLIIVNGQNYYPQDIEESLMEIDGIDLGKVVVGSLPLGHVGYGKLVVFVLFKRKPIIFKELEDRVRTVINDHYGLMVHHVVPVRKIPKTTSGKIQNFQLFNQYLNDEYKSVIKQLEIVDNLRDDATDEEILRFLLRVHVGISAIGISESLLSYGINSIQSLSLASEISDRFDVSLTASDLFQHNTLDKILNLIGRLKKSESVVENNKIAHAPTAEFYQLSPELLSIYNVEQVSYPYAPYNVSVSYKVSGRLDTEILQQSIKILMRKHAMLTARFYEVDGKAVFTYDSTAIDRFKVSIQTMHSANQKIRKYLEDLANQRFDLNLAPLFKIVLVKSEIEEEYLLLNFHHLIIDGWSVKLFQQELATIYSTLKKGDVYEEELLPYSYQDYQLWEQDQKNNSLSLESTEFWSKELLHLPNLDFHLANKRSKQLSYRGASIYKELTGKQANQLRLLSKEQEGTLFVTVIAALNVVFSRYSGNKEIVIGTDTSGRLSKEFRNQIGYFLKTLAIRTTVDLSESFNDHYASVKNTTLETLKNQALGINQIEGREYMRNDLSRTPYFDVLILMQNFGDGTFLNKLDPETSLQHIDLEINSSLLDLCFEFFDYESKIAVKVHYNPDLFSEAYVENLLVKFHMLVNEFAAHPDRELMQVGFADEKDEQQIINGFNNESRKDENHDVLHLIQKSINLYANNPCLYFNGEVCSYQDVGNATDQIAMTLRDQKGLEKGSRIGIYLDRSVNQVMSLIALMKIGAIFVPIDVEFPEERIYYIIEDAQLSAILSEKKLSKDLRSVMCEVILIDDIDFCFEKKGTFVGKANESEEIAYINYTSGTTGKPKGVEVVRRSLSDYVISFSQYFELCETDKIVYQSSLTFDTAYEEIFPALSSGCELIVSSEGGKDVPALLDLISEKNATVLSTTPLVLDLINRQSHLADSLRVIISGGDKLQPSNINNLFKSAKIYNTYGPTEGTICVTYHPITTLEDVGVIGKPLPNKNVYIVDESMKLLPVGVAGQIVTSGAGIAKGYLNKKELTDKYFISNPFDDTSRLYLTGDQGFWREDGNIVFLGRKDHQIKIRGKRVELGEIEQQINVVEEVSNCVVKYFSNKKSRLVAFYEATDQISSDKLNRKIKKYLPDYMIPDEFVYVDQMPQNINGKLDRSALKEDLILEDITSNKIEIVATDEEKTIIGIWEEVLQVAGITPRDNFFELGGYSLKANEFLIALSNATKVKITFAEFFKDATPAALAVHLKHADQTIHLPSLQLSVSEKAVSLSNAEKRFWVIDQFQEDKRSYTLNWFYEIDGAFDVKCFTEAFAILIERHDILRTSYLQQDGDIFRRVKTKIPISSWFSFIDLSDDETVEEEVKYNEEKIRDWEFDLSQAPLFRMLIIKNGSTKFRVYLAIHHIICDGYSIEILVEELSKTYNQLRKNEYVYEDKNHVNYSDFVIWQNNNISSGLLDKQMIYWHNQINCEDNPVELPVDYQRPAIQTYNGATIEFPISDRLFQSVQHSAKSNKVSTFSYLLSVFKLLLHRYTGLEQIQVGMVTANRDVPETEHLIGLLLNTVVLNTKIQKDNTFFRVLQEVNHQLGNAIDHHHYPFELLVDQLVNERDLSRSPLFNIMVGYQNRSRSEYYLKSLDQLTVSKIHISKNTSQFDLSVDFIEVNGGLFLELEYNSDLYDKEKIQALSNHFSNLLENVMKDINRPISQYNYLDKKELEYLIDHKTDELSIIEKSIPALFQKIVTKNVDNVAVSFGNEKLTYSEIDELSDQVASRLYKEFELINQPVGIIYPKSINAIVIIIALMKNGCPYVPIDDNSPIERTNHIIAQSDITYLLTNRIREGLNKPVKQVIPDLLLTGEKENIDAKIIAETAYITFTSGSTGMPKGVKVTHKNLLSASYSWTEAYNLSEQRPIVLQLANMAFDVFSGDLCRALLNGGELVLCTREQQLDFEQLYEIIERNSITIMESTPSLCVPFIKYLISNDLKCSKLQILILGSEAISAADFEQISKHFEGKVRVVNSFGTTETTIDSSYFEGQVVIDFVQHTPIGKPLANTSMYILDQYMNILPVGYNGELAIGGLGVSDGYADDPQSTSEKFVKLPALGNQTVYRTGDQARLLKDGNYVFLGRLDDQVKIRGHRVEPGEIEAVAQQYDGIDQAIVLANTVKEITQLALYTSPKTESRAEFHTFLHSKLPSYMVPTYLIGQAERFKVTSNGKVDRKVLRKPTDGDYFVLKVYKAPLAGLETMLAQIWCDILSVPQIGREDNFFELGGDSIKAARMIGLLARDNHVKLTFNVLFEDARLKVVAGKLGKTTLKSIPKAQPTAYYPLSTAQRSIWMLEQSTNLQGSYNMPIIYEVKGLIELERFKMAFQQLINKYDILRSTIVLDGNEPKLYVKNTEEFDFSLVVEKGDDKALKAAIKELNNYLFTLSEGSLLTTKLFFIASDHAYLLVNLHHLISDGWSVGIMIKELSDFYQNRIQNRKPLALQYQDFSTWQHEQLTKNKLEAQRSYWLGKLEKVISPLPLIGDNKRPTKKTFNGETIKVQLDESVNSQVKAAARKERVTYFMVLISAVRALLFKYTNHRECIIGTATSGRGHSSLTDQLGCFVNTLPLYMPLDGESSFDDLLQEVKEIVLEAQANAEYPFDQLVDDLNLDRDPSRSALFDVMVVLQNTPESTQKLDFGDDLVISEFPLTRASSKYDLTFNFEDGGDCLNVEIEYNTDIFQRSRIEDIIKQFDQLIRVLIKNPENPISEIAYLSETDQQSNVLLGPITSRGKDIIEEMHHATLLNPEKDALIWPGGNMSYARLTKLSDKVANYLEYNEVSECVGVDVSRNWQTIVAILGVVKSGRAYVPVSLRDPKDRLSHQLKETDAVCVLTAADLKQVNTLNISVSIEEIIEKFSDSNSYKSPKRRDGQIMYTLYTSGSTGKPKGARVYRDSFHNLLNWYKKELQLSEESNVLLLAPPTFDLCQKNIFACLSVGGTLALPGGGPLDFIDLVNHIERWKADTINCAPATFYPLLEQAERSGYSCFKHLVNLVLGGESINLSSFEKWKDSDYFNVRIMNSYGPTECTDVVCFHWLEKTESENIPIGLPIPNVNLYVLDEYHRVLPAGNIGNLYIGGICLGDGYVNRTLADQNKFITGTAEIPESLFMTGDKARIGANGLLYFHGRVDDQVKLNGFRIELGEIEQTIANMTGLERVVVKVSKNHKGTTEVIVCYLETSIDNKNIFYQSLKELLPSYMLPSYLVIKNDGFDLNRNGKIDRRNLRMVEEADLLRAEKYSEPIGVLEHQVANIWKEVLNLEKVGREDDFFAIGGTSMKALRVVSLIHQKYALKSTLGDIFEKSNLKDFSQSLKQGSEETLQTIEKPEIIPLSPAQRGMWHLVQVEGALETYNMSACYKIEGSVDIKQLNNATNQLLERHEILRTTFEFIDDLPCQIVHPHQQGDKVEVVAALDDLEGQVSALSSHRFDLTCGPLIKITLLQGNDDLNYLHFNTHHLIADGYSINLIIYEYCQNYNGNSQYFKPLEIQYADYSVSQTSFEQTEAYERSLTYWKDKFNVQIPVFDLSTDFTRPALKTFNGNVIDMLLSDKLISRVNHFITGSKRTSFEFFLSCLIGVLHRYTSQEQVVVGIPVSGRNQSVLLDQIGYYVNTIAYKSQISLNDTFDQLFQNTKKQWNEDLKYSEVALHSVVENVNLPIDRSRSQVFDVMFAYNDESVSEPDLRGLKISRYEIVEKFAKYDLTFNIYRAGEEYRLEIEYNTDLYTRERIGQLALHFIGFAEQALQTPYLPVATIEYYDNNLLHLTWPTPTLDDSISFDLIEEFEKVVLQFPNRKAVKWSGGSMNYTELNSASNKIADQIQKFSSSVQSIVAVAAERSPWTIIAILGVLKAGAAYLPISPELPKKRKKYMLATADVDIYLTVNEEEQIHEAQVEIGQLLLDDSLSPEDKRTVTTGELIYILFTSGSTGEPKGAKVTRKAFNNLLSWYINELSLDHDSTSLLMAPLSFDLAQKNIFANICSGGTIVVPEKGSLNYTDLITQIDTFNVTHINCAPAAFYPILEFLDDSGFDAIRSLKGVVLGGETINTSRLISWVKSNPHVNIMNSYGPTECTDVVSYHWLTEENLLSGQVPVGIPIRNAELLLLDLNGIPVPKGCVGEIAIVGLCVGKGYVGDDGLMQAKFKKNEVFDGRLVYSTGDMGRLLADDTILYLGRNDDQVKVNGQRIEPREIESVIQEFPGVTESLVIVQTDQETQFDRLVAYVVPEITDRLSLKSEMTKVLPGFMIPSHVVELPFGFPLNNNGKVDRAKLPIPTDQDLFIKTSYEPPSTEVEVIIADIWKTILGGNQIGRTSNFFELGGDSVRAVRFLSSLKKRLNIGVSQTILFANPMLKDVASEVIAEKYDPILPADKKEYYPLSSAQRGLWLLMQSIDDNGAYNIPAAFKINGSLRIDKFCQSFSEIVANHEALRTIFIELDGLPYQSIVASEHPDFQIEVVNDCDLEIDNLVKQLHDERFDFAKGPLFTARLVRLSTDEFLFLFNIHHLVSDGWSLGLMMDEITQRYNDLKVERLSVQYKDYSNWQHARKDSMKEHELRKFWDTQLAGTIPVFDFPTKRARGNTKTFEGETIQKRLSGDLVSKADLFCRERGITMPVLMLAALRILLYRYTNQNDIIIGIPDSGRRHPDLERQLGFYVNTLPLRSQLNESKTCKVVVESIKETLIQCQDHADMSLDAIIERMTKQTDRSRSPLFDVVFVFQNTPFGDSELNDLSDLKIKKIELSDATSKFDMTFSVATAKEKIVVDFTYNNYLYEDIMMEKLLEHYEIVMGLVIENFEKQTIIGELDILNLQSIQATIANIGDNSTLESNDFITSFESIAETMPGRTALLWESGKMNFEELNAKANKIAHYLDLTDASQVIAVESQRNWQLIATTLGVLKSGRSYVPIDSQLPNERISHMLAESHADLFIITGKEPSYEKGLTVKEILANSQLPSSNPNAEWGKSDQVYTLYTSGSTGLPKGARVKRSSFNNLLNWYIDELNLNEHSKMLLLAPPSFDTCQKNLFANLTVGGQIYLLGEGKIDYYKLIDQIKQHQLKEVNCAPAAFYPILEITAKNDFEQLNSLTSVVLGGESIKLNMFNEWRSSSYGNAEILNIYGPTECTDVVSCHWVNDENFKDGIVPIGHPIKNTQLHVLDKNGRLVPDGCIGEIYITGICVSDGYVGDADNSAFCSIEELNIIKAYSTGDLGRKLPNGELLFLGRIDHQIKLNGQRIEPAEIEQVAQGYREVGLAIVQFLFDEILERDVLVCYVDIAIADREDFRAHLSSFLPAYMIPTYLIEIPDGFKLNNNGKVDRKQLPACRKEDLLVSRVFEAPVGKREKLLKQIFQELLNSTKIGRNENFFELGGDSLKALQLVAKLREKGWRVNVETIFKSGSVRRLANRLELLVKISDQGTVTGKQQLSPIQEFFFNKLDQFHHYNQSVVLRFKERIDETILRRSLTELVNHHDTLRMHFPLDGLQQFEITAHLDVSNHLNIISSDIKEEITAFGNDLQSSLNIEQGPAWKLGLIRGEQEDTLIFVIHHLLVDGVSFRILLTDFDTIYLALVNKKRVKLPPKTDSFILWVDFISASLDKKSSSFWDSNLSKKRENAKLKVDNKVDKCRSVTCRLNSESTQKLLRNSNKKFGASINELLVASLFYSMHNRFPEYPLSVMMEGHGRPRTNDFVEVSRTVGWFTSLYPLVIEANNEITGLLEMIRLVKERLREIPEEGRYFLSSAIKKGLNSVQFPQISFNYLGQFDDIEQTELFAILDESYGDTQAIDSQRMFQWDVIGIINKGQMEFTIDYNSIQHSEKEMVEFIADLEDSLNSLVYLLENDADMMSPIDFTCSNLKQSELKQLRSKYDIEDIWPLTAMQLAMYYQTILEEKSDSYFVQISYHLRGTISIENIQNAYTMLIAKHPVLRSAFLYKGLEQPIQFIVEKIDPEFSYSDLTGFSDINKILDEFIKEDKLRGVDLEQPGLLRLKIFKIASSEYQFIWSHHHMILDGWSLALLTKEFYDLNYQLQTGTTIQLSEPVTPVKYFNWLKTQKKHQAIAFWNNFLDGYSSEGGIVVNFTDQLGNDKQMNELIFEVSEDVVSNLTRISNRNSVTDHVVLKTIWGILISKYLKNNDVLFGEVASGRSDEIEDGEHMIGIFINTIVVRINYNPETKFEDLIKKVHRQSMESADYQYLPTSELNVSDKLVSNFLDHVFVFQNYPFEESSAVAIENFSNENKELYISGLEPKEYNNFDLLLVMTPGNQWRLKVQFDQSKLSKDFIKKLVNDYFALFSLLGQNTKTPIGEINLEVFNENKPLEDHFNESF